MTPLNTEPEKPKNQTGIAEIILIACLSVMLATSMLQIILRNFFHTGISGADSLIRHMVLWIVFSGASIAARDGSHIKIDAINKIIPEKWLKYTDATAMLFSVIICFILMYASILFVKSEYNYDITITFMNAPVWLFEIIIPAGYGIMAVHFLIRAIKSVIQ
jgi:TRAP-type C4-dicarboxylate transport system permease small subunit